MNIFSRKSVGNLKLTQRDWIALIAIWVTATIVLTRQISNTALGYPDADRILMDGVFLHDFLRDLPLTNIYEYTITYFAQYPALSIGYRPPFFPFVEAIFNLIFGVNMWSSRLAILAFALTGLTAWFLLVRRLYNLRTALIACSFLITLPFVAKWGWYTMAELPLVSMTMLTGYLFFRFVESGDTKFLYWSAFAFVLTVWTKQTAFFLAFWMLAFLWVEGKLLSSLRDKHVWIASGLVVIALVPLAVITLWLGEQNMAQSLGAGAAKNPWLVRAERFVELPDDLVRYQLTLPMLLLSVVGMGMSVFKRDRNSLIFALLILATLIFFAYVTHKTERYTIFWLPAFAFFAALPAAYLTENNLQKNTVFGVAILVLAYQIFSIYKRPPNFATGYDQAARYVLENTRSPVVFVDAYNNGYFTYFMRAHDDQRSHFVLRADKLLTSASISYKNRLQVYAETRADIERIFEQYGVDLIVVESRDVSELEIHTELRRYLKEGPFNLEKSIPVAQENRPVLADQELLIYRYVEMKPPTADKLVLPVPVVGKTIEVPWKLAD